MKEYKGSPALDAGLLSGAQAVEHYEISRYGTLRTWAEELGLSQAATLLQTTLDEEERTDKALNRQAVVQVLRDEPKFSEAFMAHLLARNARVEEDLVDQLFNSSEKRLARVLLLMANFRKENWNRS
jgi:hypothetical protein